MISKREPIRKWYKLDNAAKIYPPTATSVWAALFRVSATFKEPIDKEIMQKALERTAKRMPAISYQLKKGIFWYYIEQNVGKTPNIQEDVSNPCMKISKEENNGFQFRVRVYNNRVALEVFHAMTDGTGAITFLKTLCAEYLKQKGLEIPNQKGILNCDDKPKASEMEDGHNKFSKFTVNEKRADKRAYYLKGTKEPFDVVHVTTGLVSSKTIAQKAKEKNLTVTEYLAGIYCYVLYKVQQDENPRRKRPVMLSLPVNLRAFYDTDTMRNFSYFVITGIDPNYGEFTQEEVFAEIHHYFQRALNEKYLNAKISKNVQSERNLFLRLVPVVIKDPVMNFAYKFVGDSRNTSTLSNLGRVDLPPEMAEHLERFDFMLGRSRFTNVNCGVIGFGDTMAITFSRAIAESYVERAFFRELVNLGIPVIIESNQEV